MIAPRGTFEQQPDGRGGGSGAGLAGYTDGNGTGSGLSPMQGRGFVMLHDGAGNALMRALRYDDAEGDVDHG